ncbi:MAG: alpha,alpha-trehalose-phosphate synthase (UDP-forming) [Gemmatimonadota bacterium]
MPPARFVLAANRLPVRWDEEACAWETSPGGLVSALTPILQEREGAWVGWTGMPDHEPDPFVHDGILHRPVPLSPDEIEEHYRGFCNGTLWPLYHNALRSPEFHRHWWRPYRAVNRRFARTIAEALDPEGAAWIHDYHLQLVPGALRRLRPAARIGFFLHIPFPSVGLFAHLPWRRALLEGLLGSDVLAFQTRRSASNFEEAALRHSGAIAADGGLEWKGRFVRLQWAPIAIDTAAFEARARAPEVRDHAASIRRRLGPNRKVLLGVDRLDYTKGIDVRLKALHTFYQRHEEEALRCAFLQIAVPSREAVAEYRAEREHVERLVGQINGGYGRPGYQPVTYMYRSVPVEELTACYVAADIMLVTPLCDGMNLVAKEYVASRIDDTGMLVLSEFAGAAAELEEALLVNPFDVNGLVQTLREAVRLEEPEQRERMAALRARVRRHDVFAWSEQCLAAIEG